MIGKALEPLFDPAEVRALWKKLDDSIPAEKAMAKLRADEIARDLQEEGGHKFGEGGGQKMGSVDMKTWLRWHQEFPGCWADETFCNEFYWHNPKYRAPGFYPKQPREFKFIK